MSKETNPTTAQSPPVTMEIGQEVRFAVVMYGGVSLAIYINGVAQELLRLVRATAPDPSNQTKPYHERVTGTEEVYRQLGQLLGRQGYDRGKGWTKGDPIRTRFIVDVLSGTSAGGINGVYLAKALANDQQIDKLEDLWVDRGDVSKLLNDGKKLEREFHQDPPQSLLSGRYMYSELHAAFEGMESEKKSTRDTRSPYVDDLDLFVTTTDIRGLPLPLRLSDMVADEKRHRNVFRFRYRGGLTEDPRNDFHAENNRLLAFAARCTSAFPFAFEPMRADDAVTVEPGKPHPWDEFFPMYRVPPGVPKDEAHHYRWSERAFGDGGYLDNKPFSYAIDTFAARRGTVPVDRKLLYVEPDPEHLDWSEQDYRRPNVLANVNSSLSLARYETIREDLERILDRNRLIERVERILAGMEGDVSVSEKLKADFARPDFRSHGLQDRIQWYGPSYGGYHRLKVAAVTDDLTEMIAAVAGFDAESDQLRAIRCIVRAWRDARYDENGAGGRLTQNDFLFEFDIQYRLRRLAFVLGKIDELFCLNDRTRRLLERWNADMPATEDGRAAFRSELTRLCGGLATAHRTLRRARVTLAHATEVQKAIARTGLTVESLNEILAASSDEEQQRVLQRLFTDPNLAAAFDALKQAIADHVAGAAKQAAEQCEQILGDANARSGEHTAATTARTIARAYYTSFESYDLLAFPILFATGVGEEIDPIEVMRISPQDATLVKQPGQRKLAGTSLGHFGAFLDEGWRRNDILWGRLDGAERLITVLLHGAGYSEELRQQLVTQAHLAILAETFKPEDNGELCQILADAIAKEATRTPALKPLLKLVAAKTGTTVSPQVAAALRACLQPDQLYEFFKTDYEVNLDLDRRESANTLGRAVRVTGKMLEDVAERERVTGRPAVWVARLGAALSALVQVAVPSHLGGDIGRRLLALLVVVEMLLVLGGAVFSHEVERFGIITLVLTVGAWGLTNLIEDFVARRRGWRRFLPRVAVLAAAVTILLAGLGAAQLPDYASRLACYLRLTPCGAEASVAQNILP